MKQELPPSNPPERSPQPEASTALLDRSIRDTVRAVKKYPKIHAALVMAGALIQYESNGYLRDHKTFADIPDDQPQTVSFREGHRTVERNRVTIDPDFENTPMSPERMHQLLDGFLGEKVASGELQAIRRSHVSIPIQNPEFTENGALEAGHCTRSHELGHRSEVVFTPEFLESTPAGMVQVFLHEVAHSIDWLNADGMSQATRGEIRAAIQRIALLPRGAIYPYVNKYQRPDAARAQVSNAWMREFFAEFMSNTPRLMASLRGTDLERLSPRDQMREQFIRIHGLTRDEAQAYAHLGEVVARWQENSRFFERVGERAMSIENQIAEERHRETQMSLHERTILGIDEGLQSLQDPDMRRAIRGLGQRSLDQVAESTGERVSVIEDIEHLAQQMPETLRDPDSGLTQTQGRLILNVARSMKRDREAYNRGFGEDFQTRELHEALNHLQQLESVEAITTTLAGLQGITDENEVSLRLARIRGQARNLEADLESLRTQFSPQDYTLLKERFIRWLQSETVFTWETGVLHRVPHGAEASELALDYSSSEDSEDK